MVLKNWGVLAQGVSQDADTLLSPPRGDNVLWLGKERAHTLPGVYAFIAIGALKTAMDPACLEEVVPCSPRWALLGWVPSMPLAELPRSGPPSDWMFPGMSCR